MANEGATNPRGGYRSWRAGDIDVIWVYGYGWPVHRGGPMFHADALGLKTVAARLTEQARSLGDATLTPAPLLARLAEAGTGFVVAVIASAAK